MRNFPSRAGLPDAAGNLRKGVIMRINEAFVLRNIYGKNILMPVCANSVGRDPILLNDAAADIWLAATKHNRKEEILRETARLYGLSEASVEMAAVGNFLARMLDMGLLLGDREEM